MSLRKLVATSLLLTGLAHATAPTRVAAAPPWLENLLGYRIVDASGRVTPRVDVPADGRYALRPAYPPSPLLRGRPMYFSGYVGATYGPGAGRQVPVPTGHFVGPGTESAHGWLHPWYHGGR